jgi:hypothetical protein
MKSAYEVITAWKESAEELSESWKKRPGFAFKKSNARTTAEVLETVLELMKEDTKLDNRKFLEEFRKSVEKKESGKSIIERLGLEDM